jgi:PAS domain-containing protein
LGRVGLHFRVLSEVRRLTTSQAAAEGALQQVAEQFSAWRQSRRTPHGPRIPEALWTEALRLVQVLPLTRVAKALHLKPHALKRRRGGGLTPPPPPARAVPFVEVSLGTRRPAPTEVEIQRPDGTRLRITYSETAPALAALVQAFLEPR